jgi:hypothetical protein
MTAKSKTQCPRERSSSAQKPLPPSRIRKLPLHSFQTFSILTNNFPFSLQASRVSGRRRSTHRYPGWRRSRRIQAQATTSAPNFPEVSETLNLQANVSCVVEIPTGKPAPGAWKGEVQKRHRGVTHLTKLSSSTTFWTFKKSRLGGYNPQSGFSVLAAAVSLA